MPKILCLATTGFGKTTSSLPIDEPEYGIKIQGLDPNDTYFLSATTKPLPIQGSEIMYPVTGDPTQLQNAKRFYTIDAEMLANVILALIPSPFKNLVIDDFNYYMQDWYMDNALEKGWDAPKQIGYFMGKVFKAIELADAAGKNVFIMAHPEFLPCADSRQEVKMKTTGKMVDEYITPSGKFDVVLLGESRFDPLKQEVVKEYLTNENQFFKGVKSPIGMFKKTQKLIPNDLGIVVEAVNSYYSKKKPQ